MTPWVIGVALGITLNATAADGQADMPFARGEAFDQQSGSFLYSETHACQPGGLHCTVQYRDADTTLMAEKTLDYRESPYAPAVTLTHFSHDASQSVAPQAQPGLVVDAGFDNFVRGNWDALSDGATVTFPFQGIGFDAPFDMRMSPDKDAECDSDSLCLNVSVDSWLLRPFLDPIKLVYSREGRELLRYSGISNLRNSEGESRHVDIIYKHVDADLQQDMQASLDTDDRAESREDMTGLPSTDRSALP